MKTRENPCESYICEGNCSKGREGTFINIVKNVINIRLKKEAYLLVLIIVDKKWIEFKRKRGMIINGKMV